MVNHNQANRCRAGKFKITILYYTILIFVLTLIFQINLDFDQLHPGKALLLTATFQDFKRKLHPFLMAALKTPDQIDRLNRIEGLHSGTSDFLYLYYLPIYLKPSKHVKIGERNCKPSIAESQNYFIRLIAVSILFFMLLT